MKKVLLFISFIFSFLFFNFSVNAKENINYNGCANLYYNEGEKLLVFKLDNQDYIITDTNLYIALEQGKKIYWYYIYQPYYEVAGVTTPTSAMGNLIITVDDVAQIYGSELSQSFIDTYNYKTKYKFNNVYIQPSNTTIGYDPTLAYNFFVDEQYSNYTYSDYDGLYQRFKYQGVSSRKLLYSNNSDVPGSLVSYGSINDEDYVLEIIDSDNTSNKITVDSLSENYCKSLPSIESFLTKLYDNNEENLIGGITDFVVNQPDINNYNYFISYDEGQTKIDITSHFENNNFFRTGDIKDFNSIFYISDKSGNILSSYSSVFSDINFSLNNDLIIIYEDSTKDSYVEVYGNKYLYAKYLRVYSKHKSLIENNYFSLYYSYNQKDYYLLDSEEIYLNTSDTIYFALFKNFDDKLNKKVYEISYNFEGISDIESVGEHIDFSETCLDDSGVNKGSCTVGVRFINYSLNHQYYVSSDNGSTWKEVFPDNFTSSLKYYYFESTSIEMNYCAKIMDNDNVLLQDCYYTSGSSKDEINSNTIIKFFDYFSTKLKALFKFISYFFNGLPIAIQYMFIFSLLMIVLLIFFKILL